MPMYSRTGRIKNPVRISTQLRIEELKERQHNRVAEKEQGQTFQGIMLGHLDIHLGK